MTSEFQFLGELLNDLRNAKEPCVRKCYVDSIKQLIEIGERLNKLYPNVNTEANIEKLKRLIGEDYKIENNSEKSTEKFEQWHDNLPEKEQKEFDVIFGNR